MENLNYYFSKIGYGNDTTCVRSTKLELIQENLTSIFGKEGYCLISQPSLPSNSDFLIEELLSSPYKTKPYLWVIGLFASSSGWTIIKTSVEDLLCRKDKSSNSSRLSELAVFSGCDVFHHSFNNRHLGVLVEANSSGETLATGYNTESDDIDNMQFYNEPVLQPQNGQNFYLLNVPKTFQTAGIQVELSKQDKQIRNEELEIIFQEGGDEEREKAVVEWKEINMGYQERFDRDLGHLICKSNPFWYEDNLLYTAYVKPEQLERYGIKLLFFQVGRFDLDPTTEEIWSPIENFNWVNYFADLKKVNLKNK